MGDAVWTSYIPIRHCAGDPWPCIIRCFPAPTPDSNDHLLIKPDNKLFIWISDWWLMTDSKSLFLCSCYLYSIWFSKKFSYWCSNYCIYLLHDVLHSKPLLSRVDLCCIVACVTSCCLPQGKDDITGEPLIQHDDDKPEALMARLRHYKDVAKPVIDLYKSVDASLSCLHSVFITVIFLHAANNVSSCCQPIKIRLKLY